MKKKIIATILICTLVTGAFSGCGNLPRKNMEAKAPSAEITAEVDTKETAKAADIAKAEEEAVRQHEANAYYEAGRACLYGMDGQKIDLKLACADFEKALELGKTEANFYLGLLCDWYKYPEQDFEKARAYYEAVADDPCAQLSLGFLYYNGQGVEKDTAKGEELFEAVIAKGCVEGYLGRGEIAETNEDYDTALECYNKVLEGEEQVYIADAMKIIGSLYYSGRGVEQDYAKALEWYEKAANLGNRTAMTTSGYMYYAGEGVKKNYNKALEWYDKAANSGDAVAMVAIGSIYYERQDYVKAMEWNEKAANLGEPIAMIWVGLMYYTGVGVKQDYAKAMEWYEKAADLGEPDAMYQIGYLYYYGQGVEQDLDKAQEWFDKAAGK